MLGLYQQFVLLWLYVDLQLSIKLSHQRCIDYGKFLQFYSLFSEHCQTIVTSYKLLLRVVL